MQGPSSAETWDAFFSDFYLRAYAAEEESEKAEAQALGAAKLAGVEPGAELLDVPCGYGRHASALARRGFRVVGVDLSRAMIAQARRRFAPGPRLTFVRRDMRRIAFREEFDAVINLYTSFGYFTPAQNQAVLRRMARALRPGGTLLVDHRDPVYDATLPRRPWYRAGAKRFILEDRRFDRRTGITESTQLVIATGPRLIRQRRLRFQEFTLAEWRRMLRRAGLRLRRAYSGYDGRPYRAGATGRLIVVAERPLRLDSARSAS